MKHTPVGVSERHDQTPSSLCYLWHCDMVHCQGMLQRMSLQQFGMLHMLHCTAVCSPSRYVGLSAGGSTEAPRVGSHITFDAPAWAPISKEVQSLLKGMMHARPVLRLTASQVLSHPWMRLDLSKAPLLRGVPQKVQQVCYQAPEAGRQVKFRHA